MKGMDGYVLCERLKEDNRLLNVPVIFVTERPDADDIDRAYAAGGVDYIVKPCHLSEFLARVRTHIHLYRLYLENERLRQIAIDSSPLTHLPGNNTVVATIQDAIDRDQDVCVIHADLDNFKAYNDRYGFAEGDELLLFTAETLQTAVRKVCGENQGFLGHIGGDDFVLLLPAEHAMAVGEEIIRRFDDGASNFYSDPEAEQGFIVSEDRQGVRSVFPLVTISLGGVQLRQRRFKKYIEVADVCAEVKQRAKRLPGSNLFIDRRENPLHVSPEPAHTVVAVDSAGDSAAAGRDSGTGSSTDSAGVGRGPSQANLTGAEPTGAEPTGAEPTGADPAGVLPTGASPIGDANAARPTDASESTLERDAVTSPVEA
jgi:diguanylate cyclase (GGDEF)-like protein